MNDGLICLNKTKHHLKHILFFTKRVINVLVYVPYTNENYPLNGLGKATSHLITGLSGETCTGKPPLVNALVALGGVANEHQLVEV